ncbi:MAG: sigma 54-interacting transcriptional regulator [Nitrospiraceae bacterium]|nr:sigma 54-interacting transcriptional regulator [Nitrospiraceae bacterium]
MNSVDLNYRTLLSVTNELNSQRDSTSLFRAITDQLAHIIRWERAGVTVYDSDSDAFKFYAVETNLSRVVLRRDACIPHARSAVGWVYDHQCVHVRPNLREQRVFLEDDCYLEEGLGRMINLPMVVQDACLGTLNIGSVETGQPDPAVLEFLQQVATQIGLAIAHVRAYEEINRLRDQLARENVYLSEELKSAQHHDMVWRSQAFGHVVDLARRSAPTTAAVMISGETGTGKEVLARAIHDWSPRRERAFVRLNCAALPSGLIESELFGHERGAFTGADHRRVGRFELADGGTLFLDEIGEMPLDAQVKLLRVLQDGFIDPVGGSKPVPVDVRIIAATNADLAAGIEQGRFRSDLFYRLNVFPLYLPPLRERPEDIPLLARHFLREHARRLKRCCGDFEPESMDRLVQYGWPGNVRELENLVERALILCHERLLRVDPAMLGLRPAGHTLVAKRVNTLEDEERRHILRALTIADWKIEGSEGAAAHLGLAPSTLRSRMHKLAIRRPARRASSIVS